MLHTRGPGKVVSVYDVSQETRHGHGPQGLTVFEVWPDPLVVLNRDIYYLAIVRILLLQQVAAFLGIDFAYWCQQLEQSLTFFAKLICL